MKLWAQVGNYGTPIKAADLKHLYELEYKIHVVKSTMGAKDEQLFGVTYRQQFGEEWPQWLEDKTYLYLAKLEGEYKALMQDCVDKTIAVFEGWLEEHWTEKLIDYILAKITHERSDNIFTDDELDNMEAEAKELLNVGIIDISNDSIATCKRLLKQLFGPKGSWYSGTEWRFDLTDTIRKINDARQALSAAFDVRTQSIAFQVALNTAHRSGDMAEYLITDPSAILPNTILNWEATPKANTMQQFLDALSGNPNLAKQWEQEARRYARRNSMKLYMKDIMACTKTARFLTRQDLLDFAESHKDETLARLRKATIDKFADDFFELHDEGSTIAFHSFKSMTDFLRDEGLTAEEVEAVLGTMQDRDWDFGDE